MSFSDPLQITYNAVTKDLVHVSDIANGAEYYLDDGTLRFSAKIQHQIPPRGGSGESHMLRIDADEHDADGAYIRRMSAWVVLKTFDNTQNTSEHQHLGDALAGLVTSANVTKLLARES